VATRDEHQLKVSGVAVDLGDTHVMTPFHTVVSAEQSLKYTHGQRGFNPILTTRRDQFMSEDTTPTLSDFVDSDVPEPPEEPEGEPVTAPEAMPAPNQGNTPSPTALSTPTPEEAASEAASSSNTPTPEAMASAASTGATSTPTTAPSNSKQLADLLKQVRDEIRALKGSREIDGTVELDPNSGLIKFVDGRIDLSETQKFEDFTA